VGLAGAIVEAAHKYPQRPALTVDGETWSYRELLAAAYGLATRFPEASGTVPPVIAIMAQRHCSSYIGILATLLCGYTYVPINVAHPDALNREKLRQSEAQAIVCGELAAASLEKILAEYNPYTLVHCPDSKAEFSSMLAAMQSAAESEPHDIAYIMFTSGSTGAPKGVPINYGNLAGYLEAVAGIMDVTPEDRFSQTFELTFDLSVHDLLVCWTHGAHLIVPSVSDLAVPAKYIREYNISCWFSVPSLAYQIQRQGHMRLDGFPSLRWSLFCGEALPLALAQSWASAAPDSQVENWYGPTEATIACAHFRLPPKDSTLNAQNEVTPIGTAFPGMEMLICGADLRPVATGVSGELLLKGRQVASGYLSESAKTSERFIALPEQEGVYYRTGDQALRDSDGIVHFLGRVDEQVKIRGYRVELGAIEAEIRRLVADQNVVAISWPLGAASGTSVVAVVETTHIDSQKLTEALQKIFPEYMVPSRIICLPTFPKNTSGKADRKAIATAIEHRLQQDMPLADFSHLHPVARDLINSILRISPNLDSEWVMQANTLMASGMDSLSFISLTAELEGALGLTLDQKDVVALSEMSFDTLVNMLTNYTQLSQLSSPVPSAVHIPYMKDRANRVLQFIEQFPDVLRARKKPFVFAIGSSGMFRGFAPEVFDQVLLGSGVKAHSLNIGMPALNCVSLNHVYAFIRDCCNQEGVRAPLILYELDPMLLSVIPQQDDIGLGPEYFSGKFKSSTDNRLPKELNWQAESRGTGNYNIDALRQRLRPTWENKRELEVLRTYMGDVSFNEEAITAWLEGIKILSTITDRLVGFIHPLDPAMVNAAADRWRGDKYITMLKDIQERSQIEIIPWEDFGLDTSDFININHVNSWTGTQKLTAQLAKKLIP